MDDSYFECDCGEAAVPDEVMCVACLSTHNRKASRERARVQREERRRWPNGKPARGYAVIQEGGRVLYAAGDYKAVLGSIAVIEAG